MQKIAIYPGTFDPITFGHTDIIKRACAIFDTLVIAAIESNEAKKTSFSIEERVSMIESEIQRLKIKNAKVISFSGLLVNFAQQQNVKVLIRGIRALSDFEYEFQMSYINHKLNPEIETLFIPATEEGHFISSSFVKEVNKLKGDLKNFVSPFVAEKLKNLHSK